MLEVAFNGLVGPTHAYAGLSPGNLAAMASAGSVGNPRAAALEGIEKMRFVRSLGALVGVLPPHPRPDVDTLRRLGFAGSDAQVLATASTRAPELLGLVSSASAMWSANAATVVPSRDATDGRVHFVPANLASMFHRSLEAPVTRAVLAAIFAGPRFVVHEALPSSAHFADEGAANHLRLSTLHVFGWGRRALGDATGPRRYPARQTLEASAAVARLCALPEDRTLFWQQHPAGIDAGAFHSDVLAVGSGDFLMLHELAFAGSASALQQLGGVHVCLATHDELPVAEAIAAYPFNSELVPVRSGELALVAPCEAREAPAARRFLERVLAEENPVQAVHYVDVNSSMKNGGGPACLRLRVWLTDDERAAVSGRVIADDALLDALGDWVRRHYRDRLTPADLADPALLDESRRALDELTGLLELGPLYDFQKP